jgi:hypothetical protein
MNDSFGSRGYPACAASDVPTLGSRWSYAPPRVFKPSLQKQPTPEQLPERDDRVMDDLEPTIPSENHPARRRRAWIVAARYEKGKSSISASAVTRGASVLVLGTTTGTTISAKQVIVQTTGGSAPSSAAAVVPFKRGAPTTAKTAGKIPAAYTEGSGTIVRGTTANKATEAALAAYPGVSSTVS